MVAYEKVTLYGVPIVVANRKVNYGRIDPELSRELFIRHALVEGDWQTRTTFFHDNRALLDEVEELEHRARRRDILVDDETLFDFYDAADPGRGGLRPALRQLVEEGPAGPARPAHLRPDDAGQQRSRRRSTEARLPGRLALRAVWRCR